MNEFNPDHITPPGEFIQEYFVKDENYRYKAFMEKLMFLLFESKIPINEAIAELLEEVTKTPKSMFLNWQKLYDEPDSDLVSLREQVKSLISEKERLEDQLLTYQGRTNFCPNCERLQRTLDEVLKFNIEPLMDECIIRDIGFEVNSNIKIKDIPEVQEILKKYKGEENA